MQVVNIKDPGGYQVYGGRPRGGKSPVDCIPGREEGWLGNPVPLTCEAERDKCIAAYKSGYFWPRVQSDSIFLANILALKGKRVACFCFPRHCHLDVVKAFLDWTDTPDGRV